MKLELKVLTVMEKELNKLFEESQIAERRLAINIVLMPILGIKHSIMAGNDIPEFWETINNLRTSIDKLRQETLPADPFDDTQPDIDPKNPHKKS